MFHTFIFLETVAHNCFSVDEKRSIYLARNSTTLFRLITLRPHIVHVHVHVWGYFGDKRMDAQMGQFCRSYGLLTIAE